MCVDGGPQPLESGHPRLRMAVVRMAYDSCEDGHGAAVYVHQGLGDDELDDLEGGLLDSDTDYESAQLLPYPFYEVIRDMIPPLIQFQQPRE